MKTTRIMILVSAIALFTVGAAVAQEATIQIIHNSPDPAATTVDIYVNAGADPAVPDLAFRAATGLITLPSDTDLVVGIAPGNSSGPEDVLANWTFNLPSGSMTVVMASGLLGDDFDLFTNALETGGASDMVGILAFHGAPDAPAVDVGAMGVGTLISNLEYQTFQGYLYVPAADYILTVAPTGGEIIAGFDAPLSGLGGGAAVVFASGFLGMEPGFGLYAALTDGVVIPLTPNGSVATEEVSLGTVKALYR
ncbi:MAG: DUF4397 domain-containing protein [Candidatus Krumholzibacteria bacterium]|nr:DUF4397 domain-containing protein [Candidatus Krumholzibacteria bacterium]